MEAMLPSPAMLCISQKSCRQQKANRSHTIAGLSLRAQNSESLYAISLREIAYNITIHPLARFAGEGAGG
jgi:hypothetical protein